MERSTGYIIGFAAAVCLVCSVLVTSSAVSLKDRQEENKRLDR
ncbi:MAG: Na(+)-translocating NADH-quinone reductase subunit C, partial [Acidobacteria bacterium]|nr:Na(+)-translocating NADH-quinone reductase subunit C [Candidatus Polarisedimenticola svalbardensis]